MAFFERADESDILVLCNMCNVKCAERSMMTHRVKCYDRNTDKFTKGILKRCEFDSGHIVDADKMDQHLEFCTKHQNEVKDEFQRTSKPLLHPNNIIQLNPSWGPLGPVGDQNEDDWNRTADGRAFIKRMENMSLK